MNAHTRVAKPGHGSPFWTRRRFLLTVLAGLASCGFSEPDVAREKSMLSAVPGATPDWLRGVTGEPEAVARIGALYLAAHPEEGAPEVIFHAIEQSMAATSGGVALDRQEPEQVIARLQAVVRREYAAGEVLMLGRWLISRTEARLYGAVALLSSR